ncbi:MAG: hypothetical protein JWM11_3214 [Planctomycetaceae bacterium]|nr:hypothetical protein [Planctomycetaceae bacterium]
MTRKTPRQSLRCRLAFHDTECHATIKLDDLRSTEAREKTGRSKVKPLSHSATFGVDCPSMIEACPAALQMVTNLSELQPFYSL